MNRKLSIVISVYNEEGALGSFYVAISNMIQSLDVDTELMFVNDGSTDSSLEMLKNIARKDHRIRIISFSRNFGHEAAMLAGIDYCTGDYIICMDADLQHPVECIPKMLQLFMSGHQVISMVRTSNKDAGIIKNISSSAFYSVINKLSDVHMEKNASDFFGISRVVANVLKTDYRERVRFIRGYIQNVGYKKAVIQYEAAERVAGESKYNLFKLFKFSINTILCFSNAPLKLGIYAGVGAMFLALIMAIYTVITWLKVGTPNGYATIIVLICFMFGVLFLLVGIIGEYISVLFTEVKGRPIYIVEEVFQGKQVEN